MANLTAEDPDQLKCFRFAFTESSTFVCEFPITVCNDFSLIGGDVGILCSPPPTIINRTNPPVPIIYSSNAQSCTVDCGGFSESYEVAPGTFVGLSQAQADARADAFACQLAAMQCTGSFTVFTSSAQTCSGTCPDGTPASYTTPAGFFSALSQAEADFQSFMFACEVAALLCASQPPVAFSSSAGVPRTAPVDPLYANFAQACSSACSNGSIFSYTIPGGTHLRESRLAANAVAASAACRLAQLNRVCLSDLPTSLCVDEFVAEFLTTQ